MTLSQLNFMRHAAGETDASVISAGNLLDLIDRGLIDDLQNQRPTNIGFRALAQAKRALARDESVL